MSKKKSSVKKTSKKVAETSDLVMIYAKVNARLTDGRFVKEGQTAYVDQEYAKRLKSEKDSRFIISI